MPNTGTLTGLTAATEYVLDAVHMDAWGNISAVSSSGPFTTEVATAAPAAFTYFANDSLSTFTGAQTGTADESRRVIVFCASVNGSPPTGCTIGGVAASLVDSQQALGFVNENITVWDLAVTTGTTADIAFTGGTASEYAIAVARTYGKTIQTPVTKGSADSGGDLTLDVTVNSGDDILAVALGRNNDGWTWTGLADVDERDVRSNEWFASAVATGVAAASPRAITAATGAGASAGIALVLR